MILEIEDIIPTAMRYGMFSKSQFLDAVKAKAKTQAAISRTLGISEAAVSGMYGGKVPRDLTYDEAVKLADTYDIDPNKLTVAKLMPTLLVCMRYAPKEWTDRAVERLAQDILYGLEILQAGSSIDPSPDAIEVAGRAIADRHRNMRDDTSA